MEKTDLSLYGPGVDATDQCNGEPAVLQSGDLNSGSVFPGSPPAYTPSYDLGDPSSLSANTTLGYTVTPGSVSLPNHSNSVDPPQVRITAFDGSGEVPTKQLSTAIILGLVLGFFGAHHFYLNNPRFGTVYIFTMGLFGLGWITDICRMPILVKRTNSRLRNPDSYFQGPEDRDLFYVYLTWLTLGIFGVHHYYLRRFKWAVLYTLTVGLFGVGWFVDAFRLPHLTKDTNKKLEERRSRSRSQGPKYKKLVSAYLLWIPPFGILGAHQYYLGRNGFGVAYTLTGGLGLIGWLADGIRLSWLVKRVNRRLEQEYETASDGRFVTRDRSKHCDDAYILHCSPFGLLGAAMFYLGRYRWAIPYFFTFGFLGIGWIVDMFRLKKHVKDANKSRQTQQHQLQIQYSGNTQIVVMTDGRVVAQGDARHPPPVLLPVIPTATALTPGPADQPPSYDSIMAESSQPDTAAGHDNADTKE